MQVLPPYSGKGSTNGALVWYNICTKETQGHIHTAGFKLVLCLMPKRSASAILAQTLAERWWDTTYTFHITDREMTITPHNFHHITGLWFNRLSISLEDKLGTQLGVELLERRYATKTIRYTNLEADFVGRPQGTTKEFSRMAKVFLLYLLGANLFANGGQTMSLR